MLQFLNCIEFSENKSQYINISRRVTDIYYVNSHELYIILQRTSFLERIWKYNEYKQFKKFTFAVKKSKKREESPGRKSDQQQDFALQFQFQDTVKLINKKDKFNGFHDADKTACNV